MFSVFGFVSFFIITLCYGIFTGDFYPFFLFLVGMLILYGFLRFWFRGDFLRNGD